MGDLLAEANQNGIWTQTCDALGRTVSELGAGFPSGMPVTSVFDEAGNRVQLLCWRGIQTYSYDGRNLNTTLADIEGGRTTWSFDPRGLVSQQLSPNGVVTTWSYDGRGETTLIQYGSLDQEAYSYDPAANPAVLNRGSFGVTTYSYDALSQLLTEWGPSTYQRTWSFDPAGNRLTEQSSPGSWETTVAYFVTCTFDAVDRQVTEYTTGNQAGNTLAGSSSLNTFSYDGNDCRAGEQSQLLNTSGSPVYLTTYLWEPGQRLLQTLDGYKNAIQTHLYRADGMRQQGSSLNVTRHYVWDGDDLLAEVDQNGTLLWFYTRGTKEVKYHEPSAPTDVYYNFDRLGSTAAWTYGDGTLAGQLRVPAWGGQAVGLQSSISGQFIREPGYLSFVAGATSRPLYYVRARWLLAGGPGWLSPEPLRFQMGDVGLYQYAANQPTALTDPSGLIPSPKIPLRLA